MAIIPSIPGVQAEVRINGERAEEYTDSSQCDEGNTTIRYIQAISGAKFTIHCRVWHPYDPEGRDIELQFWVDGTKVRGKVIRHEEHEDRQGKIDVNGTLSIQNGQQFEAPMVFSELDIDDNDTDISSPKVKDRIASAGDIRIELCKGKATTMPLSDKHITIDRIGKIPEEALKGRTLSHQVRLQEYEPIERCGTCIFDPDIGGKIATFVFKYRSKSALQAEGIIPRTPSPTPLEERPLEELSREELRELLRRHRERDAAAAAVKREFKAEDTDGDNKTGMELAQSDDIEITTVRPVKRRCISGPDEAIDLTGG